MTVALNYFQFASTALCHSIRIGKTQGAADELFGLLSDRASERLKARCRNRHEGWIFPAFSASGHLTTVDKKFRQARLTADSRKNSSYTPVGTITAPECCREPAILRLSFAPSHT